MVDVADTPPLRVDMVEVVDLEGRLLCVLPASEAHRQRLRHRSALVLVHDGPGRLLLAKRPPEAASYPDRWDLPAAAHLPPGRSREEAARLALAKVCPGGAGALVHQGEMPPCEGTGFEAVSVFRHTLPVVPADFNSSRSMFVSLEELTALTEGFRELLTPTLVHLLESGVLDRRSGRKA